MAALGRIEESGFYLLRGFYGRDQSITPTADRPRLTTFGTAANGCCPKRYAKPPAIGRWRKSGKKSNRSGTKTCAAACMSSRAMVSLNRRSTAAIHLYAHAACVAARFDVETMDGSFVHLTRPLLDELSLKLITDEQKDFANAEQTQSFWSSHPNRGITTIQAVG